MVKPAFTRSPLTARALTALRGSIAKWRAIVNDPAAVDRGAKNCALCQAFPTFDCAGCPVAAAVHDTGCGETPHDLWVRHHHVWHEKFDDLRVEPGCLACAAFAAAELAFLEALLPVGEAGLEPTTLPGTDR